MGYGLRRIPSAIAKVLETRPMTSAQRDRERAIRAAAVEILAAQLAGARELVRDHVVAFGEDVRDRAQLEVTRIAVRVRRKVACEIAELRDGFDDIVRRMHVG